MHPRILAVCDLLLPSARDQAGLHGYDGQVMDLSPSGVASALGRLGGEALPDAHDEAHLAAFEARLRVAFGELAVHRRSPMPLLSTLDVAGYDRDYAPAEQRAEARRRHLAAWPDAIDAGLASLDAVPAPTARALLPAVRGLGDMLDEADDVEAKALAAHGRLVSHLEHAADQGAADVGIGADGLSRLLSSGEATRVDLGRLEESADAERERVHGMLADACAALRPGAPVTDVVAELNADHPTTDTLLPTAQEVTDEVIAFTRDRGLLSDVDGECRVAPSPPSRRWAMATMAWSAPHEDDGPSVYYLTPPEASWSADDQDAWLGAFSHATLPATTTHEVAPGHFAHSRMLRRVPSEVRKTLQSSAFVEGWAHYAEELCLEEGFRDNDPRVVAGVAVKALLRLVRLAVSVGVHAGTMDMDEAVARFESDAFLSGPAAEAEAYRATFDPTYGRYAWGKLVIRRLRDDARRQWGSGFTLRGFHDRLLTLGAPPLGLVGAALEGRAGAAGVGGDAGGR